MAATSGSIYQLIRTQHVNNNPPNCYPQTNFENFKSYFIRMEKQGLPVDIGSDESDSEYQARLRSYNVTPLLYISASFATVGASAASATTAVSASYALSASYAP